MSSLETNETTLFDFVFPGTPLRFYAVMYRLIEYENARLTCFGCLLLMAKYGFFFDLYFHTFDLKTGISWGHANLL